MPQSKEAFQTGKALATGSWRLGLLALAMLLPVTLPVPVLRALVQDRFGVSEFLTSLFMAVNMIGAVLAAPLAGVLADRFGERKRWIVVALGLDSGALFALSLDLPFAVFLGIRFIEGAAHIAALSLLLSLAADLAPPARRGRFLGVVGGGMMLGVTLGAPLGGVLGRQDPLLPLEVGAGVLAVAAGAALLVLREAEGKAARPGLATLWRHVAAERALLVPLAFAFADRFTVGFFTTTFTLYVTRIGGFESTRVGLLLGLFLLPFAALSFVSGRLSERVSRTGLVAWGSLLYGLAVMTLGYWHLDALGGLMLVLGMLAAAMFVPSLLLTVDLARPEVKSTALACFNAAGSLGFIVGPVVGGAVSESVARIADWNVGYTAAFVVAGSLEVLCVLLTLPAMHRFRTDGRTT